MNSKLSKQMKERTITVMRHLKKYTRELDYEMLNLQAIARMTSLTESQVRDCLRISWRHPDFDREKWGFAATATRGNRSDDAHLVVGSVYYHSKHALPQNLERTLSTMQKHAATRAESVVIFAGHDLVKQATPHITEGIVVAGRLRRSTNSFLTAERSGNVKKAAQEKRKMQTYHRSLEKRGFLHLV